MDQRGVSVWEDSPLQLDISGKMDTVSMTTRFSKLQIIGIFVFPDSFDGVTEKQLKYERKITILVCFLLKSIPLI
jgi:hypothetical protein